MKVKENLQTGLILPVTDKSEGRKLGLLELKQPENRRFVVETLQKMYIMEECRFGPPQDRQAHEIRKKLIEDLAHHLLGPGVGFWEYT